MSITTTIQTGTTTLGARSIPRGLLSDRQQYLASLSAADLKARLHYVAQRFEVACVAFEDSPDPQNHRHLAATAETIAQDVLETACALLGDTVFQALLDAVYAVEESLFDPDDDLYLI
jgi:hypothetical protein